MQDGDRDTALLQKEGRYVCTGYDRIWHQKNEDAERILTGFGDLLYSCVNRFSYNGESLDLEEMENLVEDYEGFEVQTVIYRQKIEETGLSEQEPVCMLNGYVEQAVVRADGSFFLLLQSAPAYLGIREEYILAGVDNDGKILYQKTLEPGCRPGNLSLNIEGEVLLLDRDQVMFFNDKGKKTASEKLSVSGQVIDICGSSDNIVYLISMDRWPVTKRIQGKEEKVVDESHAMIELSGGGSSRLLARNAQKLYFYAEGDDTWQELADVMDWDILPKDIVKWWMDDEEKIYVVVRDFSEEEEYLVTAQRRALEDTLQKEVITLGVNGNGYDELQRAVVNFNRSNESFRVKLVDYLEKYGVLGSEGIRSVSERMKLDFVSGEGADMICTDLLRIADIPMDGLLTDLTPYLDQSKVLSRNDFYEEVLQAADCDGALVYLTDSFTVSTLLCRSSLTGADKKLWTMEKVLELADTYPKAVLFRRPAGSRELVREYAAGQMVKNVLMLNQNRVFGEELFDKEVLIQLLNKAKDEYDLIVELQDSAREALKRNELLLVNADISDFYGMTRYYQNVFDGQDMAVIGYPSENGQGKSVVEPGVGIGILSTSKRKEAAWAFLEYYILTSDGADQGYFSSRKYVFEEQLKTAYRYAQERHDPDDADYIDETAVQYMDEILENAVGRNRVIDEEILKIISEEAQGFYCGDKPAETTAEIINGRVRLYLGEK